MPQGLVFGSILFCIFINDIPGRINHFLLKLIVNAELPKISQDDFDFYRNGIRYSYNLNTTTNKCKVPVLAKNLDNPQINPY